MSIDRARMESVLAEIRRTTDAVDHAGFANLFAKDATFQNSLLDEPVRGREALRALTAVFPRDNENRMEWAAIDGNRLTFGWNERQARWKPETPSLRGISTFLIDDDGLIISYEAFFDTAALAAAWEHLGGAPNLEGLRLGIAHE